MRSFTEITNINNKNNIKFEYINVTMKKCEKENQ